MTENILPQAAPAPAYGLPQKPRVSVVTGLLAIILFVILVMLGERIIFDLNRVANPIVEKSISLAPNNPYGYGSANLGMYASEGLALSSNRVYYRQADRPEYLLYKLLIHSAVIIPIFLVVFLFYYLYHIRQVNETLIAVIYAYISFAFWMLIHLLGELGYYIIEQYKSAAVYIILVILAAIITPLIIFLQKRRAPSAQTTNFIK